MSGLVIGGREVDVPGLVVRNWNDDPRLKLRVGQPGGSNDGRRRRADWIRLIVVHTTKGIPGGRDKRAQVIRLGTGPDRGKDLNTARFWSSSPEPSGAHLVVDADGSIACLADLRDVCAYHATVVNDVSIGIEIFQGDDAELYEGQLEATATLCDFITTAFSIQRQIPDRYRGPLPRLESGGADVVGVVGHRDVTDNRGPGDPGDAVFDALERHGYERFNLLADDDLRVWRDREGEIDRRLMAAFGRRLADPKPGVPGPRVVAALVALGYGGGLWATPPAEDAVAGALDDEARTFIARWVGRGIPREQLAEAIRRAANAAGVAV